MIPASYLFKDYYRRHWLDADPAAGPTATQPSRRLRGGLMRRVTEARWLRPTGRAGLGLRQEPQM